MTRWWISLWARTEHPRSLAAVRIALASVLVWDLLRIRYHGLVATLMGGEASGGLGVPASLDAPPWIVSVLGTGPALPEVIWWSMTLAATAVLLGILPRLSALVLVLVSAQFALVLPAADRGIDMLMRNVLLVLACSGAGSTWSVASLVRHRSWTAPESARVPAWPRYLIAAQLVVVYFTAGVSKAASSWTPIGGLSALYIAMSDPHFQRLPDDWIRASWRLTQVGTLVTWLWEWFAPVILLAWWYRETPDRPGRLRAWMNARPVVAVYLAVGAAFHVGTHLFLRLGIFPFAMLSLYPACFPPDRLERALAWVRQRRRGGTVGAGEG